MSNEAKKNNVKPDYTVRKSIVKSLNIFLILGSILVVPFFVQIVKILDACCDITKFYGTKIMRTKGILNKDRRQTELVGSYKVSIAQTRIGEIFNYGNVTVEGHNKWKFTLANVKNPYGLKKYLEDIQSNKKFKL